MNTQALARILSEVTMDTGGISPVQEGWEVVDLGIASFQVDSEGAGQYRNEFISLFADYPKERLQQGQSHLEAAEIVGDSHTALKMFALGQALGLWEVETVSELTDDEASNSTTVARGFNTSTS